jgi:SRSO17 transposase
MQRLLNRASWDTLAAMSEVRRFGAAGLAEAARRGRRRGGLVIAAIDETGQEKAGEATAGVKRQYMGCADCCADGLQFDFACGDEVYGGCTQLREFFEENGQAYVLRVASNFMITLAREPR